MAFKAPLYREVLRCKVIILLANLSQRAYIYVYIQEDKYTYAYLYTC